MPAWDDGYHSSNAAAVRGDNLDRGVYGKPSVQDLQYHVRAVQAARVAPVSRMTDGTMCKSCDAPVDVLTGLCRCSS